MNQNWNEITLGAALNPFKQGTSFKERREDRKYEQHSSFTVPVSDWRNIKPVYNRSSCIDCQNCWVFCPDAAIISKDKILQGIDYDHCKGCGVCAEVCPTNPKSLVMFEEVVTVDEALSSWPAKVEKEKK